MPPQLSLFRASGSYPEGRGLKSRRRYHRAFLLMERYYLTKGRDAVSKIARSTKPPQLSVQSIGLLIRVSRVRIPQGVPNVYLLMAKIPVYSIAGDFGSIPNRRISLVYIQQSIYNKILHNVDPQGTKSKFLISFHRWPGPTPSKR